MRRIDCPAGRRVCLLRPVFSGGGRDVVFRAVARDGGPVEGTIEETSRGFLGQKSRFHPLRAENRFRIGALSQGYRLHAIAGRDTEVQFLTGHTDLRDLLRWGAIGLGVFLGLPVLLGLVAELLGLGSG